MGQTGDNEAGDERSTALPAGPQTRQWLHGHTLSKTEKIDTSMDTPGEATDTSE
jgi:hypothetical protein